MTNPAPPNGGNGGSIVVTAMNAINNTGNIQVNGGQGARAQSISVTTGNGKNAVAQVTGTGPASQIAMEDRDQFAFVFTMKNRRCVREQAFRNKDEALEAAGLSE